MDPGTNRCRCRTAVGAVYLSEPVSLSGTSVGAIVSFGAASDRWWEYLSDLPWWTGCRHCCRTCSVVSPYINAKTIRCEYTRP